MFKDEEINQMNNEIVKLRNISDVSNLGNVHTLNLSNCYGVKDISMLENVNTLKLSSTTMFNISKLKNVLII